MRLFKIDCYNNECPWYPSALGKQYYLQLPDRENETFLHSSYVSSLKQQWSRRARISRGEFYINDVLVIYPAVISMVRK